MLDPDVGVRAEQTQQLRPDASVPIRIRVGVDPERVPTVIGLDELELAQVELDQLDRHRVERAILGVEQPIEPAAADGHEDGVSHDPVLVDGEGSDVPGVVAEERHGPVPEVGEDDAPLLPWTGGLIRSVPEDLDVVPRDVDPVGVLTRCRLGHEPVLGVGVPGDERAAEHLGRRLAQVRAGSLSDGDHPRHVVADVHASLVCDAAQLLEARGVAKQRHRMPAVPDPDEDLARPGRVERADVDEREPLLEPAQSPLVVLVVPDAQVEQRRAQPVAGPLGEREGVGPVARHLALVPERLERAGRGARGVVGMQLRPVRAAREHRRAVGAERRLVDDRQLGEVLRRAARVEVGVLDRVPGDVLQPGATHVERVRRTRGVEQRVDIGHRGGDAASTSAIERPVGRSTAGGCKIHARLLTTRPTRPRSGLLAHRWPWKTSAMRERSRRTGWTPLPALQVASALSAVVPAHRS